MSSAYLYGLKIFLVLDGLLCVEIPFCSGENLIGQLKSENMLSWTSPFQGSVITQQLIYYMGCLQEEITVIRKVWRGSEVHSISGLRDPHQTHKVEVSSLEGRYSLRKHKVSNHYIDHYIFSIHYPIQNIVL